LHSKQLVAFYSESDAWLQVYNDPVCFVWIYAVEVGKLDI
jgi:hypothetical protein